MKGLKQRFQKIHRYLKRNSQELTRLEVENTMPEQGPQSKLRKTLSSLAGLFILFMAIVGIVFSTLFFHHVHLHKKEQEYLDKVAYYQSFIAPVVSLDMGEFVDLDNANNYSLLVPAFFKAQENLYSDIEERESITPTNTPKKYIVRLDEVNKAANQLFGRNVIPHKFAIDGLTFDYVENEKYFLSPTTFQLGMYTPNITAITPTENGVDLTVQYMEAYQVRKTMKISLQGEYKKEIITAVTAAE